MRILRGSPSALAESSTGAGAMSPRVPRPLVLLGLPGSGKSTVGPLVASRLGCPFVDLDAEIERREGRTIPRIFAESGEAHFRELERRLTAELFARGAPPLVLSPGGGWVEQPSHRALFGTVVDAVYLRVSPAVASARMGGAVAARPLLAGGDPVARLTELLDRREAFYLQANHALSVDSLAPDEVASSIVALASDTGRD